MIEFVLLFYFLSIKREKSGKQEDEDEEDEFSKYEFLMYTPDLLTVKEVEVAVQEAHENSFAAA